MAVPVDTLALYSHDILSDCSSGFPLVSFFFSLSNILCSVVFFSCWVFLPVEKALDFWLLGFVSCRCLQCDFIC